MAVRPPYAGVGSVEEENFICSSLSFPFTLFSVCVLPDGVAQCLAFTQKAQATWKVDAVLSCVHRCAPQTFRGPFDGGAAPGPCTDSLQRHQTLPMITTLTTGSLRVQKNSNSIRRSRFPHFRLSRHALVLIDLDILGHLLPVGWVSHCAGGHGEARTVGSGKYSRLWCEPILQGTERTRAGTRGWEKRRVRGWA